MAKINLAMLTNDELHGKLKTLNALQVTTSVIFIVIILAWIILGFWKTNLPVFIITVVVAIGLSASQFASGSSLRLEIKKRGASGIEADKAENQKPS